MFREKITKTTTNSTTSYTKIKRPLVRSQSREMAIENVFSRLKLGAQKTTNILVLPNDVSIIFFSNRLWYIISDFDWKGSWPLQNGIDILSWMYSLKTKKEIIFLDRLPNTREPPRLIQMVCLPGHSSEIWGWRST